MQKSLSNRLTRERTICLMAALTLLFVTALGTADVPTMVNFQGLVTSAGTPYNGAGYFKFAVMDASTGNGSTNYWANDGTASGEPGASISLTVTDGVFSLLLGNTSLGGMTQSVDETVFSTTTTYLRVWFSATGGPGTFVAQEPNQRMGSVAYALQSTSAHSHFGQWWSGGAATYGLRVTNNTSGPGNYALYGSNNSSGPGVRGSGNIGYGVYGSSSGVGMAGVYGIGFNGYGVHGSSSATTGGYGGVYGEGTNGVVGQSSVSSGGRGVYGNASTTTGVHWGVFGQAASFDGVGVLGANYTTSGPTYGVYGYVQSGGGSAVHGWSLNSSGYAGYFNGKVHVAGTLSKSSGSFKIDHPLDPENKYLYHSFVESPDMMNIYNGNVSLDANGEAWVEMPDWFDALNQEFRYQLTPIGAPGPSLHIAEQIQSRRFKIAGGESSQIVSWQVTGIRHDPYAEAHRIPVEELKPPEELGTYLNPVEHGQPETMGIDYQRNLRSGMSPTGLKSEDR